MSRSSWWGSRLRQFRAHLRATVAAGERTELATWLTAEQLGVFDGMHVADKRHGLDVVKTLRAEGVDDPDLLMAGLLHDAGKGPDVGLWPRVAWSLGERYGAWIPASTRRLPGFRRALDRLRDHAELSAALATQAGCSRRTVELIRNQADPLDQEAGRLLLLADEAN
jgi:hypothetical protein